METDTITISELEQETLRVLRDIASGKTRGVGGNDLPSQIGAAKEILFYCSQKMYEEQDKINNARLSQGVAPE